MEFQTLLVSIEKNTALIKLNRPDKLNALSKQVFDDLNSCVDWIEGNDDIGCAILTGEGKAFAAGADIKELNRSNSLSLGRQFSEYGSRVMEKIFNLNKPVIAAVNGFALGGGCELAMSCHMRYASEKAKFGQPEVNLGIIPGYGGTQRLTKLIGFGKALEMNLTGDMINSDEAKRLGLVNDIYSPESLITEVQKICDNINSKAPLAVSAILESMKSSLETGYRDGLALESRKFGEICATEDFYEGTMAFLEKREAVFKGS